MKAIKIGTKIEIYNDTVMTFNELPARAYIVRFEKMTGFYLDEYAEVEIKEDKLTGLTPQLTELKKNAPFLFEKKLMYLTGYSPEASSDLIPKINTADMTYSQAVAFLDN